MKTFRTLSTLFVVAVLLISCEVKFDWPWLKNSGTEGASAASREVSVGTFDTLTLLATGRVVLDSSVPVGVVRLSDNQGKAGQLTAELKGSELVLGTESGVVSDKAEYRLNPGTVLKKIVLKGMGDLSSEQSLKTPQLLLRLEGLGRMELAVEADGLTLEQSGAGLIKVSGSAVALFVNSSGLGQVDAENLVSLKAEVRSSGVGEVRVNATQALTVKASGVGAVHYAGKPAETHFENSGPTEIKPLD